MAGTFVSSALLVGVAAWLGLGLQLDGLAVLWPVAGVMAGLTAAAPRGAHRLAVSAGALLALGAANLAIGRPLLPALVLVAGNLGESLIVVGALERAVGGLRFDDLRSVVVFLAVCAAASAAVGAAVAAGLVGSGFSGSLPDAWWSWLESHLVGLLTVAPALAALASGPAALRAARAALRRQWGPVALLGGAAYLLLAWMPLSGGPGALLAATVLYALLLWIAVRCETVVATFAVLALGAVAAWQAPHGGAAMGDDFHALVVLLVGASVWTLTIGAVLAQQRLALQAATDSELRLREAMLVGRAFAFEWDPVADRVVRTDPSGIVGDTQVEPSGAFFEGIDPQDRPRFERALASLSPERPSYTIRYRYRRREDGRTIWLEERAQARFDGDGRLAALQGMSADATERAQAETALREADRTKDRFIATLSHELRNPLAPIRTAAEVLRRLAGDSDAADRCHRMIDRQLRQMVYLLDEMLDVGRISQGKLRLSPRRVTLDEVLDHACAHVLDRLDAAGQRLEVRRPDAEVVLQVDPARLVQAIDNLLGNASKYSARGARIGLEVSVEPGAGGGTLVVAVHDEGVGVPPADLERVFDMFTQLETPGAAGSQGGLGIGLWLVRRIVTMQGGRVSAHSAGPGQGATFTIRLPVVVSPEDPVGAPRAGEPSAPAT